MSSSEDGFRKLRIWKELSACLSVTVVPPNNLSSGATVRSGDILLVDEGKGFAMVEVERDCFRMELSGARFRLAKDEKSLDVELANGERWQFVESRVT